MPAKKEYRWLDKDSRPRANVQKPEAGRWVRPAKMKPRDEFVLHRRGIFGAAEGESDLERRAVSHDKVKGSIQERIAYKALEARGIPFDFQPSVDGGRLQLGGMVADFILSDRPVIIRVQTGHWHTGLVPEHKDAAQKAIMEGYGYTVLDLWDYVIEDQDALDDWLNANVESGLILKQGAYVT